MNRMTLETAVSITRKQSERLRIAYTKLAPLFPLTPEALEAFSDEESMWLDLLIYRFSQLQDHMGAQLFELILEAGEEDTSKLFMIDKINLLEKKDLIDSAVEWKDFRKIRNHLSHEYPDNFELMAKNLNATYAVTERLLAYAEKLCQAATKYIPYTKQ